jgi:hypothetical protein
MKLNPKQEHTWIRHARALGTFQLRYSKLS